MIDQIIKPITGIQISIFTILFSLQAPACRLTMKSK